MGPSLSDEAKQRRATGPLGVRVSSNGMKQLRVLERQWRYVIATDASSFLNCPSIRFQVLETQIRTYNTTLLEYCRKRTTFLLGTNVCYRRKIDVLFLR